MHWVEIINARMSETSDPEELIRLFTDIQNHVTAMDGAGLRLAIYRHGRIENDWSIHLRWETDRQPYRKTELGIKLAEMIRMIALVDHSLWIEQKPLAPLKVPNPRY